MYLNKIFYIFIYFIIYTVCAFTYTQTLYKQILLFWMQLIVINNLTALNKIRGQPIDQPIFGIS